MVQGDFSIYFVLTISFFIFFNMYLYFINKNIFNYFITFVKVKSVLPKKAFIRALVFLF